MKLKNENTNPKKLSEKKMLKEGPGAGYTVKTFGVHDVKISKISYYKDYENGSVYSVYGTLTIDGIQADGYYDGTGKIEEPIQVIIQYVWLSEYDLNGVDLEDDAALIDLAVEAIYENPNTDFVYGGGWSHAEYDGQVGEVFGRNSDYWQGYIDNELSSNLIDFIDKAVTGDNYSTEYRVVIDDSDIYDYYETEEEAIKKADELAVSRDYIDCTITVERTMDYYDYYGDWIDMDGYGNEQVYEVHNDLEWDDEDDELTGDYEVDDYDNELGRRLR